MNATSWFRSIRRAPSGAALLLSLLAACGSPAESHRRPSEPLQESQSQPEPPRDSATTGGVPSLGSPDVLEVAVWNLAWFGSADFDPADDALQLDRVTEVIAATDIDLWGLDEVVDRTEWAALLHALPEYGGVLASDPGVTGGPAAYYDKEQKPALLYRRDVARVLDARLALTDHDHAFAGRPPLQVELEVVVDGRSQRLVVLVVHMKAGADADDRDRRETAARVLKAYLDRELGDQPVLVIGDFNDDVDTSIHAGSPTPYAEFVGDTANWAFPTASLSEAGISSMTRYPDLVDHHLYSNEMVAGYVAGSARVVRLDEWIDGYETTTSDHFPVLTVYDPVR